MVRTAIAQHHRLHHRRPVQVVDVVERSAGGDQAADDLDMAEVRRGDQRSAVIRTGDKAGIVAEFDGQRHQLGIVRHRGDGDHVISLMLQRVHIGPGLGKRAQGGILRGEGRYMGRGAAAEITGIQVGAIGGKPADGGGVTLMRGAEQPVVAGDFAG